MRISVRPVLEPDREVDVTHRLVAAIAEELWRLYGGNDRLNWLEAERHLERIVADASERADGPGAAHRGATGRRNSRSCGSLDAARRAPEAARMPEAGVPRRSVTRSQQEHVAARRPVRVPACSTDTHGPF